MVKYFEIIDKNKKKETDRTLQRNFEGSDSDTNNDFEINIKIKKKKNKDIKIGKQIFDEETIARVSIVKLSKLNYTINQICKILDVTRMFPGNGQIMKRFQGKGCWKQNSVMKKKNFYVIKLMEKQQLKMEHQLGVSKKIFMINIKKL